MVQLKSLSWFDLQLKCLNQTMQAELSEHLVPKKLRQNKKLPFSFFKQQIKNLSSGWEIRKFHFTFFDESVFLWKILCYFLPMGQGNTRIFFLNEILLNLHLICLVQTRWYQFFHFLKIDFTKSPWLSLF